MPRWAAASSPSRRPLSDRARSMMATLATRMIGSARRQPAPRGAVEAAEQVGEDLAQRRARQVHRHRQAGGEQRPDRIAGQQQARQRRQAADPRQPVDRGDRRERPDEREAWSSPNWRMTTRTGMSTAIAAPRAAPDAVPEHVRVGQRVAEQALERRAGDGEPAAHEHRRQDPRQAQVQTIVSVGVRPRRGRGRARGGDGRGSRACRPARRPTLTRARRRATSATTSAATPDRPAGPAGRRADAAGRSAAPVGWRRGGSPRVVIDPAQAPAGSARRDGSDEVRDGSPARARAGPRRDAGRVG